MPRDLAGGLLCTLRVLRSQREFQSPSSRQRPSPLLWEDSHKAFAHPDSLRRFRTIESREDLEQALAAPWETWSVFLHPSQRRIIEREFSGPARVADRLRDTVPINIKGSFLAAIRGAHLGAI
jgi:hypothetical protein